MSDDRDDDPALRAMRSVWLSMRDADEDPPDRGMAALLAAARQQADQMKPAPSWWSRVVATLRRPPVLAMATAVVLIGGAVVISQRTDADKEHERVLLPEHAGTPVAARDEAARSPSADTSNDLTERVEGETTKGTTAPAEEAVDHAVATRHKPMRAKPEPKYKHEYKAGTPKLAAPSTEATAQATSDRSAPASPPPPPAGPGGDRLGQGATPPLAIATDGDPAPGAAPEAKPPVTRRPLPPIVGEDRANKGDAKTEAVAQLVKQCEVAAANHDCAAVRAIAQKIAQQDPALYKTKVSKNPDVARCLAP